MTISLWSDNPPFTEAEILDAEAAGAGPHYRANAEALNAAYAEGRATPPEAFRLHPSGKVGK